MTIDNINGEHPMRSLGEFKNRPGSTVKTDGGTRLMMLKLCAGMIRNGHATGGLNTTAVVNLETGETGYWSDNTVCDLITIQEG